MKNKVKRTKIVLGIIIVLYFMLAVMSIISEFTVNTNDKTVGNFSMLSLLKTSWWPILVASLLVVAFILYSKKHRYGAILEIITGGIILANTIRNMINYGSTFLSVVLTLLLPAILIIQGTLMLIYKDKESEEKIEKKTKDISKSRKTLRKNKTKK